MTEHDRWVERLIKGVTPLVAMYDQDAVEPYIMRRSHAAPHRLVKDTAQRFHLSEALILRSTFYVVR